MLLLCYLWQFTHIFYRGVSMQKKDNLAKKFAEELQLPEGAVHKIFTIEFHSNTQVSVDGCMGMVEYSDSVIAINLGDRIVRFHGNDLEMDTFFDSQAVIKGTVLSMDFS